MDPHKSTTSDVGGRSSAQSFTQANLLIRSVTLVSIMFMMPMPPTRSRSGNRNLNDISVAFICVMDERHDRLRGLLPAQEEC